MTSAVNTSEELRLLRHQLNQANSRLAESEAERAELRRQNVRLASETANAQNQLRAMRSSPAWRVSVAILSVEDNVRRGIAKVSGLARDAKRRTIG